MPRLKKDPDAVIDYHVNWATKLDGDTISTSSFTVPTGITKDSESNTDTIATVWLSDGTAGNKYQILNRITTSGGRTRDFTFTVYVTESGGEPTAGTLAEVRREFVKQSGHYELVTDSNSEDYSDNGADWFINAGQRFLDQRLQYPKFTWLYKKLTSGDAHVTFNVARYVSEVWLAEESEERNLLEKKTHRWIKEEFEGLPLSGIDTGTPKYWCITPIGLAPEQEDETSGSFDTTGYVDYDYITFGDHFPTQGIIVMPPADGTYTLAIKGVWHNPKLSADADVSFWTTNYPEYLVRAARMMIENDLHRNSSGSNHWEQRLMRDIDELRNDLVEEELQGDADDWVMEG